MPCCILGIEDAVAETLPVLLWLEDGVGADTIVVNDLSGTDPTEYETDFGGVAAPTGALGGKETF